MRSRRSELSWYAYRGLLQETKHFRSVKGPNEDPIPSRDPLERDELMMPLIKSKWASLEAMAPLRPPYDGAPWRNVPVSRNLSYAHECTRESQRDPREDLLSTYVESP